MHVRTSTHVMIAGSRYATREMLDYARRTVRRAHQLGWIILVGDNPKGVDMAVVQECRRLKTQVIVAGIANFPRNYGCKHGSYLKIARDLYRGSGGYLLDGYAVRDRWMVDMSQQSVFVWNGDSLGTLAGYEYAVQRGKAAHLINFDRSLQPHG
ncbi:MAG: hypothetical protein L6Q98_20750 [Anaerolineae bacterium]|nr:hypothetical protein [Anaerolineae bacterium]NUQ06641.1 hypothetical protein [Anaerolineae bacterium]